jgi:hypothetical protein
MAWMVALNLFIFHTQRKAQQRESQAHNLLLSLFITGLSDLRKAPAVSHSPPRPLSQITRSDTPGPPPKSFRNSLTTNLRLFAPLPLSATLASALASPPPPPLPMPEEEDQELLDLEPAGAPKGPPHPIRALPPAPAPAPPPRSSLKFKSARVPRILQRSL